MHDVITSDILLQFFVPIAAIIVDKQITTPSYYHSPKGSPAGSSSSPLIARLLCIIVIWILDLVTHPSTLHRSQGCSSTIVRIVCCVKFLGNGAFLGTDLHLLLWFFGHTGTLQLQFYSEPYGITWTLS